MIEENEESIVTWESVLDKVAGLASDVALLVSGIIISSDGEMIESERDMSIKELAIEMKKIKAVMDAMDISWKDLSKRYDILRLKEIPDAFAENDVRSMTIEGIGRVGLTKDVHVSILETMYGGEEQFDGGEDLFGNKDTVPMAHGELSKREAYEWLKDNGFDSIVAEYVQPSTLKATVKDATSNGVEFPERLFKINQFMRASITKTK